MAEVRFSKVWMLVLAGAVTASLLPAPCFALGAEAQITTTGNLDRKTMVLDPGHGESDTGPANGRLREKNQTLDVVAQH